MNQLMRETLGETFVKEPSAELSSAIMKRLENRPLAKTPVRSNSSSWMLWLFLGLIFFLPMTVGVFGLFVQNWGELNLFANFNFSVDEFFSHFSSYWQKWQTLFVFLLGFGLVYSIGKLSDFASKNHKLV